MTERNPDIRSYAIEIGTVARRFIERAEALDLKGVKRDHEALSFFCGAGTGAELAGDDQLCKAIALTSNLIIAVRGFIGVKELAAEAATAEAKTRAAAGAAVVKATADRVDGYDRDDLGESPDR